MKRIIALLAAALLVQAAFADDAGEPSEESVLDAARAKYWQESRSSEADDGTSVKVEVEVTISEDGQESEAEDAEAERDSIAYTPFLLSFVPGLSAPFGYYDVSFAAGAVGCMVRDVNGAAGAGVFTMARNINGFQAAGVFNMAEDVHGVQAAGVFNIGEDVYGVQAAGVFNIAEMAYTPIQAAGVFNIADEVNGFQAAGVFNIADRVKGGQAAGVINVADEVKGVQIGLINIADEIDGIQIGLLNIAGNGVDSFGVIYEPITDSFSAQWQTGTPYLFTTAGVSAPASAWFSDWSEFSAYAGLGTRARVLGINLDADICAVQPIAPLPTDRSAWKNGTAWNSIEPYPSLRLMAGVPLFGKRAQIIGGLKLDIDIESLGDILPENRKVGESWSDSWFGERFTVWPKWFIGVKL